MVNLPKEKLIWESIWVLTKLFNHIIKYSTFNMLLEEWSWLIIYFSDLFINKKDLLAFVVQSLTHVRLFVTPWSAIHQASLSFTVSPSLLKLMSIESVMPSNYLILCFSFSSCLLSFPVSGSFLMSQLFAWGDQSIGASASAPVLPMNIHNWFPLWLTSLISFLSKGLSRVVLSDCTTVRKYQFFGS